MGVGRFDHCGLLKSADHYTRGQILELSLNNSAYLTNFAISNFFTFNSLKNTFRKSFKFHFKIEGVICGDIKYFFVDRRCCESLCLGKLLSVKQKRKLKSTLGTF
jgi:hypothetical protein